MTNQKQHEVGLMSWPEYQDKLANNPVIFIPVGAMEQHGPHLPMTCDAIFSEAMAIRTAKLIDGLVMPVLSYGYKSQARSGGGQTFPGTTSLDGETIINMIKDIIRELLRHGVERIVIVNGHVENQWFLTEGIDLAIREAKAIYNDSKHLKIIRCEYWDYTPQIVLDDIFDNDFPGVDLEHAALLETSMMLALHPEYVRDELIPNDSLAEFPAHDHYPQDGRNVPASGVLAPAAKATKEKGELLINETTTAMAQALTKEFDTGND